MRYARKADAGQLAIMEALRAIGATVEYISGRKGVPDLLIGFRGRNLLLEVKGLLGKKGGKSRDGQKLSEAQEKWHLTWRGQVRTARSVGEAVAIVLQLPSADGAPPADGPETPEPQSTGRVGQSPAPIRNDTAA